MTDRHEQARDAAERTTIRMPLGRFRTVYEIGHGHGVRWADANHSAVEALARVRELHRTVESHLLDQTCAECSNGWDLEVIWPCATHQATEVEA